MFVRLGGKNDNGSTKFLCSSNKRPDRQEEHYSYLCYLPLRQFFANADNISRETPASQPRGFKFPNGFAISQNPKYYSNETGTLTLIDKVIKPYVEQKRKDLKLQPTQKALLVWGVFKGQKTDKVLSKLASLNVEVVSVPANMTHFFQPLDLTVNGEAKRFMKDQFTNWY